MTFRELLEKYKNQTATPEERKQVEAELEKYNALTEYLLEQDVDMEGEDLAAQQEELQKIDRSMKKRGRRIIAIAVVIACVVMGALTAFQPAISKVIWYDPAEQTMQEFASDMDCHLTVFSELTMPESGILQTRVYPRGWGVYDLDVEQYDHLTGEQTWFGSTVNRGKIRLDSNLYDYAVMNSFTRGTASFIEDVENQGGVIRTPEAMTAILKDLPDFIQIEAYVSLGRDWTMKELTDFVQTMEQTDGMLGWVGVRVSPEEEQRLPLMGFRWGGHGYVYNQVNQQYPYYETGFYKDEPQNEVWEKHFLALLQYTADHADFYERLDGDSGAHIGTKAQSALDYVRENGVKTYGFLYYGTAADFQKLLENEDVEGMYISDYRLDVPGL